MTINIHSENTAKESLIEKTSICELTNDVIQSLAGEFAKNNIAVDADLPSLTAEVNKQVIHSAVAQLLENAIQAMPDGGQVSVTLIDGQHHWELEIADSVGEIYSPNWKTIIRSNQIDHQTNLLRVCSENPRLEFVRNAAMLHGGQVQSWVCPQGGTANVLVIPRMTNRNQPARVA